MTTDSILVYSFRRCPFAMRVRLALHEKQIPFEVQEEDLKNFSPQLRALHPEARVPVLVRGQQVVYESCIITEYVDDLAPTQFPLMPPSADERAQVRLWTYWCNNVFKRNIDRFKYGTSRFTPEQCVGAKEDVLMDLRKLEDRLQSASWLVGEQLSLADIHVFPFARQLSRIQPRPEFLAEYPATTNWIVSIEQRPSFQKAMEK